MTLHSKALHSDDMTTLTTTRTCRAELAQRVSGIPHPIRWACTLTAGHSGPHKAQGIGGDVKKSWKRVTR